LMTSLFPKLDVVQRAPRKLPIGICTGGPGYDYICRPCVEVFGIKFAYVVENQVGRKACAYCGQSDHSVMDTVDNDNRKEGGCIVYYKEGA
jgi:hypothetical protein